MLDSRVRCRGPDADAGSCGVRVGGKAGGALCCALWSAPDRYPSALAPHIRTCSLPDPMVVFMNMHAHAHAHAHAHEWTRTNE